jgi:hypothetical protein
MVVQAAVDQTARAVRVVQAEAVRVQVLLTDLLVQLILVEAVVVVLLPLAMAATAVQAS